MNLLYKKWRSSLILIIVPVLIIFGLIWFFRFINPILPEHGNIVNKYYSESYSYTVFVPAGDNVYVPIEQKCPEKYYLEIESNRIVRRYHVTRSTYDEWKIGDSY